MTTARAQPMPVPGLGGLQHATQFNSAPSAFLALAGRPGGFLPAAPLSAPQGGPFQQQQDALARNASMPDLGEASLGGARLRPAFSTSPNSSSGGGQLAAEDAHEVTEQRKRSQNRGALAQKRFRERQKEKMRENERQVEQLTAALASLTADKARLESKTRLLEAVVSINLQHEARLHTCKEIMVREQGMLLDDLASFVQLLGPAVLQELAGVPGGQAQLQQLLQTPGVAGTPFAGMAAAACSSLSPLSGGFNAHGSHGMPGLMPMASPVPMPSARAQPLPFGSHGSSSVLGASLHNSFPCSASLAAAAAAVPIPAPIAAAAGSLLRANSFAGGFAGSCGSQAAVPPGSFDGGSFSGPASHQGTLAASLHPSPTPLGSGCLGGMVPPPALQRLGSAPAAAGGAGGWRPAFGGGLPHSSSSSALAGLSGFPGTGPGMGPATAAGSQTPGQQASPRTSSPTPVTAAPVSGGGQVCAAPTAMDMPSFGMPPRAPTPAGCLGDDLGLDVPCLSQMMDAPELLSMLDDLPALDPVDSMLQLGELGGGPGSPCASGIEGMLQEHQLFLQQQEHQQQQDADQERCQQQEGVTAMEVKRSATPLEQQTSSSTGSPLLLAPGEEAGGQASQGAVTGEALGTWSLHFMAEGWYPVYMCHLRKLLHASMRSMHGPRQLPSPETQQLVQLVMWRRTHEDRRALFSHYYWALFCYNQAATAASPRMPLPLDMWRQLAANLLLSPGQQAVIAAARQTLQSELMRVAGEWQHVLSTLALELLQMPREQWASCSGVPAMVRNLIQEREAVLAFVHTIVDEVLTPQQEAQLDVACYPWCPDFWALSTVVTLQHQASATAAAAAAAAASTNKNQFAAAAVAAAAAAAACDPTCSTAESGGLGPDPMPLLAQGVQVLQPLMPFMTAFQLLRAPLMVHGAGLRLKRALLLDPFRTVVPAAAFAMPGQQQMHSMTLMDAHCGSFQQVMLLDWLHQHAPAYLSLLPEMASYSSSTRSPTPSMM